MYYLTLSRTYLDENSKNQLTESANTGEEILFLPPSPYFERLKALQRWADPLTPTPCLKKAMAHVEGDEGFSEARLPSFCEGSMFSILWERGKKKYKAYMLARS